MTGAEKRSPADVRRVASATCALLGLMGFLFCTVTHICMGGHMAHPPYVWWDYLNDVTWGILFVTAAVFSRRSNMPKRRVLAGGLLLMGVSRAAGSLGSFLVVLAEAPAFLVVALLAAVGLFRKRRDTDRRPRRTRFQPANGPDAAMPSEGESHETE